MTTSLIRRFALVFSLAALGASSATAIAAKTQHHKATHFLKVSPSTVKAGGTVRLHGSVDHGCQTPGQLTIYSHAFKGSTKHTSAGGPAVYATAKKSGAFSKKVKIQKSIKPGTYHIGGRCGGGNFGSATLKVT